MTFFHMTVSINNYSKEKKNNNYLVQLRLKMMLKDL